MIRLRAERATIERRPVDRPASEADFANFKEGTIEVRETTEEPVVAKTARVVEEVVVGKEVQERTETVADTVRRTDVEIERMGADTTRRGTDTTTATGDVTGGSIREQAESLADRGSMSSDRSAMSDRGSMSDRGRVFIVLGHPSNAGQDLAHSTHHGLGGNVSNPGGGGRMRGGRNVWIWEHADATKFDMPKIEVVFVEDPGTFRTRRDVTRQDYPGAEATAIRKAVAYNLRHGWDDMVKYEEELCAHVFEHPDAHEGTTAFLEKREPRFKDL
jgi:uncharacterized protein (TIGR02271 family)